MSESDYSQEFSPNPPIKAKANTARESTVKAKVEKPQSRKSNKALLSIEDFDIMETKQKVNSPRTLEACKAEGVLPKELLHVPKSKFKEPGLPNEVAELRYEFHENKRKELIELVKKARQELIEDLDRSTYDHPTMAGSTLYQTPNGKFLSARSIQTSKSSRSKVSMRSSGLLGDAMNKDKEVTQKQMEVIQRIKEKEQKRFEKYLINEERKNKIVEEKEARFEQIRLLEKKRNEQIKQALKEENEKKMVEEIQLEKEEQLREKQEKKQAWEHFITNLEEQKKLEEEAEKQRREKELELKKKEQERLEKVKAWEEAQLQQQRENEIKIAKMNEKYQEQMHKMKQFQIQKKQEAERKALEKRKKIQQIMKAKEEQEKRDLARFLEKQQVEMERDMALKRERNKSLKEIRMQAEEKNKQKERILKQAEERMQEKIDIWMEKQKEADKRLEKLKEQERFKEILRKEFITLNNQSKFYNKKRFQRKTKYQEERMREKLAMEDMKIEAMADQRNELKDVRKKALNEMERQRQDIKNALYHMTVWNSFSPKVVEKIWNAKASAANRPTVEEMVRVHAAKEHLKKDKNKHRRTSSALELRPLRSSQSSKKHMKPAKSQRAFHGSKNAANDVESDDYEEEFADNHQRKVSSKY